MIKFTELGNNAILGEFHDYSFTSLECAMPEGYRICSLKDLVKVSLDEKNIPLSAFFSAGRSFVANDFLYSTLKGKIYFGHEDIRVCVGDGETLHINSDQFSSNPVTAYAFGEYARPFGNLVSSRFGKTKLEVDLKNMCLENSSVPVLLKGISGVEQLSIMRVPSLFHGNLSVVGVPKK